MRKTFILPILAILTVLTVSMASAVAPICATVETTYVSGIITDQSTGLPIEGAEVVIDCNGSIRNATSDANGGYSVQYPIAECTYGDSVSVSATYDGLTGDSNDVLWYTENKIIGCLELIVNVGCVNVPLIPEFGLIVGTLTIAMAITVFFVVRRK
jgi:hypothetical protein